MSVMGSKTPKFSRKNLTVCAWMQQDVPVEKYVNDVEDTVRRLSSNDGNDRGILAEKIVGRLIQAIYVETGGDPGFHGRIVKAINDTFGTSYTQAKK